MIENESNDSMCNENWKIGAYPIETVQGKMLDIVLAIDRVCQENGINYILDSGTLIGAMRHHGFIPWDDDLDIAMERSDFEKFRVLARTELPEPFKYVDSSIEDNFPVVFGKCFDTSTLYLEESCEHLEKSTGVWVDIFPYDKVTKKDLGRRKRFAASLNAIRCLNLKTVRFEKRHIAYLPFTLLPIKILNQLVEKNFKSRENEDCEDVYPLSMSRTDLPAFSGSLFRKIRRVPFEGALLPVPIDYDEGYLQLMYGNWRRLPPIEKQHPTHLISKIRL
ncbi:MAG: LicD family protein [Coriobacteriaceae bacterium]|nr:LicD family protein [Coriobacteriaceae bacterium]